MDRIIIEGNTPENEKLVFIVKDPIEQIIKEVTQCQKNEQQP